MNRLCITIIPPKDNNNHRTNVKKITLKYKVLPSKISQATLTIKENGCDEALLEINGTKVQAFTLLKILENTRSGVTQTLSAKDEIAEVLLHIVGSDYLIKRRGVRSVRWLTKARNEKILIILDKLFDGWLELFGERIVEGVLNCMKNLESGINRCSKCS